MGRIIDNAIALRVVYLLVTPIEKTDAFKLGLIDHNGKTIKKAKTAEEKNATSMLHRLCWNLKRIISLIPGGSTKIGSLTAAYFLVRESYEKEWTDTMLAEETIIHFHTLTEANEETNNELNRLIDQLANLYEDAPANSAGAMPDSGGVAKNDVKLGLAKRKQFKTIELPGV
jgi:hypothetical protein